jgi:hypothetical protein
MAADIRARWDAALLDRATDFVTAARSLRHWRSAMVTLPIRMSSADGSMERKNNFGFCLSSSAWWTANVFRSQPGEFSTMPTRSVLRVKKARIHVPKIIRMKSPSPG